MATLTETLSGTSVKYVQPCYADIGNRHFEVKMSQTYTIGVAKSTINWSLTMTGGSSNYYQVGPVHLIYSTDGGITWKDLYRKNDVSYWNSYAFPAARGTKSGTFEVEHEIDGTKSIRVKFHNQYIFSTNNGPHDWDMTWELETIPTEVRFNETLTYLILTNETTIRPVWAVYDEFSKMEYSLNGGNFIPLKEDDISYDEEYELYSTEISGLKADTDYTIVLQATHPLSGSTSTIERSTHTHAYPHIQNFQPQTFLVSDNTFQRKLDVYNPHDHEVVVYANSEPSILTATPIATLTINTHVFLEQEPIVVDATTAIKAYDWGSTDVVKPLYYYVVYTPEGEDPIISSSFSDIIQLDSNYVDFKPSFEGEFEYQDIAGYKDRWSHYLTGRSNIKFIKIPNTIGWNNATIVEKTIFVNGKNYTIKTDVENNEYCDIGILNTENNEIRFEIIDSRGFKQTKIVNDLVLYKYIAPSFIFYNGTRYGDFNSDQVAFYAGVDWDEKLIDIDNSENTVIIEASSVPANPLLGYIDKDTTEAEPQIVSGFNPEQSYAVTLTVRDSVGGSAAATILLNATQPIVYTDPVYRGVGINCFPNENGLQIKDNLKINGKKIIQGYDIDLSIEDVLTYYPIIFDKSNDILECEITTNNEKIYFNLIEDKINIKNYFAKDPANLFIGSIGTGAFTYTPCIWLKGGYNYTFYSNIKPTLYNLIDYENESEKYTIGSNTYGGENEDVNILFIPQETIVSGSYSNENFINDKIITDNLNVRESISTSNLTIENNITTNNIQTETINNKTLVDNIYPIGSIYISDNNTNPSELFGGTWEQMRVLYGGELLAYGSVLCSSGSSMNIDNNYAFSSSVFGTKTPYLQSYIENILTFDTTNNCPLITTNGIVGMVEVTFGISGLGTTNTDGIWFKGPLNTGDTALPEGVLVHPGNLTTSHSTIGLFTGPFGANYGGTSHNYFYQVNSDDKDLVFHINPCASAYNGSITPSGAGTHSFLMVKVYAKYETSYMWKRVENEIVTAPDNGDDANSDAGE